MKRFVVLLLALTMIFSLAACGSKTKTTTCELCGKEAECKALTYEGETGWFCVDTCYDLASSALDMLKAAS